MVHVQTIHCTYSHTAHHFLVFTLHVLVFITFLFSYILMLLAVQMCL